MLLFSPSRASLIAPAGPLILLLLLLLSFLLLLLLPLLVEKQPQGLQPSVRHLLVIQHKIRLPQRAAAHTQEARDPAGQLVL